MASRRCLLCNALFWCREISAGLILALPFHFSSSFYGRPVWHNTAKGCHSSHANSIYYLIYAFVSILSVYSLDFCRANRLLRHRWLLCRFGGSRESRQNRPKTAKRRAKSLESTLSQPQPLPSPFPSLLSSGKLPSSISQLPPPPSPRS